MNFELKLRSWILNNYGTVSAFAGELGISQTNISRYLNGSRKPGHQFYKKINKMGCDLNWLFEEETEKKNSILKKIKNNSSLLSILAIPFFEDSYITQAIILLGI